MAYVRWDGGATAVAQVSTITVTESGPGDTVTITLTGEDGSTQTVDASITQDNDTHAAQTIQSACAASTQSLFSQILFTQDGAVVTLTARVAGRPFYFASSKTGTGDTAMTDATTTANAGPNDWNTTANWSTGSKPASNDFVSFSEGSFDVLYGLDQDEETLQQLSVNTGYRGNIGTNTAALRISVNSATANAPKSLDLGGSGFIYNFQGTYDRVVVKRNIATTKIRGAVTTCIISGQTVSGNITFDPRTQISSADAVLDVTNVSPGLLVTIPSTAVAQGDIFMDSGRVDLSASTGSGSKAIISGTAYLCTKPGGKINNTTATPAGITLFGGTYRHESNEDLAATGSNIHIAVYSGLADFSSVKSKSGAEFVNAGDIILYAGTLDNSSSGGLVEFDTITNYNANIIQPAGVSASSGFTKR